MGARVFPTSLKDVQSSSINETKLKKKLFKKQQEVLEANAYAELKEREKMALDDYDCSDVLAFGAQLQHSEDEEESEILLDDEEYFEVVQK